MSEVMIEFDGVWKKFRRGERHDSLRDLVPSIAKRLFRRGTPRDLEKEEFWALKDVSFEVKRGEALGIIGPNGAGKSTTLKLLNRILRPTKGSCWLRGRVGALIEVAAGFHPDLTGRENVFLQGAIMGMKRAEIATKLDEIIEFSGVAEFVDTQVKRYSSGMNARLGFAIAAHLDPDVLIIDEVLSVGDMTFQQKCVNRMLDFKGSGVAIVFVSHNLNAISKLCDRAVLLNHEVIAAGDTQDVLNSYVRLFSSSDVRSTDTVSVERVSLQCESGTSTKTVSPGDRLCLSVTYRAHEPLDDFHLGFLVHRSSDGLLVYDESFSQKRLGLGPLKAADRVTVDYPFSANLTRGQYDIELHVYHIPSQTFPIRIRPAAIFQVSENHIYDGIAFLEVRPRVASASMTRDSETRGPVIAS